MAFIDGFAGPGEYSKGEPGSPVIAITAAKEQRIDLSKTKIQFLFIEEDRRRAKHLEGLLGQSRDDFPEHLVWAVHNSTFQAVVDPILEALRGKPMIPVFVMIDPFGAKGVPYGTVRELGARPQCDVLISLMYELISRFQKTAEFEPHMDDLFGVPDWRDSLAMPAQEKREFLQDLYRAQLEAAGWKYIRSFEMWDEQNKLEYVLFFGTHHEKGLEVIKDAMWKVDPAGKYRFSDATNRNQMTMFAEEPDYSILAAAIQGRYAGSPPVRIDHLESFVLVETAFRKAHLRKNVLDPLESQGKLEVLFSGKRRARTYPTGSMLRFT